MKLNDGRITFLVNQKETTIKIRDHDAGVIFAEITLTPEQLSMVLSRLESTPCKIEVSRLDKVGLKMEYKNFASLKSP